MRTFDEYVGPDLLDVREIRFTGEEDRSCASAPIQRSHGVNVGAVRELRPLMHGENVVVLDDGTELTSGRSHRRAIQTTFGLA
jgi:hypothetical protein